MNNINTTKNIHKNTVSISDYQSVKCQKLQTRDTNKCITDAHIQVNKQ